MGGYLELEKARVRWFLSLDRKDIPENVKNNEIWSFRNINIDGKELEFSDAFTNLHTAVYKNILRR